MWLLFEQTFKLSLLKNQADALRPPCARLRERLVPDGYVSAKAALDPDLSAFRSSG